jgi:hypothetical protein
MSGMLEEAIIDATSLRESAIRSAQSQVIEKYAPEIQETVDNLLEQLDDPEDLLGGGEGAMEDSMLDDQEGPVDAGIDVPMGHEEGDRLCPCPGDEEEVEINFDQLRAGMEQDPAAGALEDELEIPIPGEDEEEEFDLVEEDLRALVNEELETEEKEEINEDTEEEVVEEEKELEEVNEEVNVDWKPTPSGQVAAGAGSFPGAKADEAADQAYAALRDDKNAKELKELQKRVKDLQEQNANRDKKIKKLTEHLKSQNISNAKLLYTNRILRDSSLNERQKSQIAESISKASTVDEAKVVFETLQRTKQGSQKPPVPESLTEAISRRPSPMVIPRKKEEPKSDPHKERMMRLAGIKKGES